MLAIFFFLSCTCPSLASAAQFPRTRKTGRVASPLLLHNKIEIIKKVIFYGFVRATRNNGDLQPRPAHILRSVLISEPNADFDHKKKNRFVILHLNCIDRLEPNFYAYAVIDTPNRQLLKQKFLI